MRRLLALFGLGGQGRGAEGALAAPGSTTTIGIGITIKGELRDEGTLTNISARAIVVAGVVHGNLSADTRVEILPTGALTGAVKSGSFTAADGATVKGRLWVERPARVAGPRA